MHRNRRLSSPARGANARPLKAWAVAVIAFAVAGLAGCSGGPKQAVKTGPTPAETAYVKNIQITPGRVEAAQNFLQHTVTTVHAAVTNKGKKVVLYLAVNLTFSDIEGKPIQQKEAYPISGHTLPLKPGETRAFQVSFDLVPAAWNQAPPQMSVARVILLGEE